MMKYLIKSFPIQKGEIVERNGLGLSRTTPESTVYTEAQFDDDVCINISYFNRMTVKMQF